MVFRRGREAMVERRVPFGHPGRVNERDPFVIGIVEVEGKREVRQALAHALEVTLPSHFCPVEDARELVTPGDATLGPGEILIWIPGNDGHPIAIDVQSCDLLFDHPNARVGILIGKRPEERGLVGDLLGVHLVPLIVPLEPVAVGRIEFDYHRIDHISVPARHRPGEGGCPADNHRWGPDDANTDDIELVAVKADFVDRWRFEIAHLGSPH
ncbi:MAG: hypothetical protein U5K37_10905 [Natrialbaceae archaeon]|nr:hypothetical protein [Natrialbaceae archaeon]